MSDEQKAQETALEKQLAQWDELEAAYKEQRDKLADLHAAIKDAKAEQRALDLGDPGDVIRGQQLTAQIEALQQAVHAQRGRKDEARGRLSHYQTWLRMPGTRRKRGGVSFWEMRSG